MKSFKGKLIVIFLVLFISVGTLAIALADTIVRPNETQNLMQQFLKEFTEVKKFMISEEKFNDPKNAPEISRHLKKFADLTKEAAHDPRLNQEAFKFSRKVLEDQAVNTERVFRLGSKSFARWQLVSTASVCTSCHSQAPAGSRAFTEFLNEKIFSNPTDQAEFLFATRGFERAFAMNDKVILNYPVDSEGTGQVEQALERQVAYFSRIKRNPADGAEKMRAYRKNEKLPPHLLKNLDSWIQQFENLKNHKSIDPKKANEKEIVRYAEKNLDIKWTQDMMDASNPNLVTYLYISGVLYEYLQTHTNNQATPSVLYWLAVCDRSINNNFFYSLADMYLKECILTFPASKIAKECFKEYSAETINGYTGSGGIHLPEDVKVELQQLQELINSNGKLKLKNQ